MALDFSLGISWQFGALALFSMLLFPFFRGRYAFLGAALAYSLVDVVPALLGAKGTVGLWTLTGAITWGMVGVLFSVHRPDGSPLGFMRLSVLGTIIFDGITGVILSPILWGMPLEDAFMGQIPFTIKHLLGITALAVIFAPLLFPSISKNLTKAGWAILKPVAA